jgi:hypothetical protein
MVAVFGEEGVEIDWKLFGALRPALSCKVQGRRIN